MSRTLRVSRLRKGFTLIELLVVLAIIALLAAILLSVFRSAQGRGPQVNCASNLKQIWVAVKLYYQDERAYPGSLAFVLPNSARLDNNSANVSTPMSGSTCDNTTVPGEDTCANTNGIGYLKATDVLMCSDDDNQSRRPRSSYGDVSTGLPATFPTDTSTPAAPTDLTAANASRFLWNYWGYNPQGFAYMNSNDAAAGMAGYVAMPSAATPNKLLLAPNQPYSRANPIKASLSNRFAPPGTIITHCIYHRQTTSELNDPIYLYSANNDRYRAADQTVGKNGLLARDFVLRLDGSASFKIVGTWPAIPGASNNWQAQKF